MPAPWRPFRSEHSRTIGDLIVRGGQSRARGVELAGQATARAQAASGQIYGGMWRELGDMAGYAVTDIMAARKEEQEEREEEAINQSIMEAIERAEGPPPGPTTQGSTPRGPGFVGPPYRGQGGQAFVGPQAPPPGLGGSPRLLGQPPWGPQGPAPQASRPLGRPGLRQPAAMPPGGPQQLPGWDDMQVMLTATADLERQGNTKAVERLREFTKDLRKEILDRDNEDLANEDTREQAAAERFQSVIDSPTPQDAWNRTVDRLRELTREPLPDVVPSKAELIEYRERGLTRSEHNAALRLSGDLDE